MGIRTIALLLGLCAVAASLAQTPEQIRRAIEAQNGPANPVIDDDTRFDDRGEPLPKNALARLGGGGFRLGGAYQMAVAFHPDGRHFAAIDSNGTVRVWHIESGREVRRLAIGDLEHSVKLFFRADGRLCVSLNGVLSTFDAGGAKPAVVSLPGRLEAVSPGGRWLLARQQLGDEQKLTFVDAMIPDRRVPFATGKKANAENDASFLAAVSADASVTASARVSERGGFVLEVWNATAHRRAPPVALREPTAMGLSDDGRWLAVADTGAGSLRGWQVERKAPNATPELRALPDAMLGDFTSPPRAVRFARKGPVAYVGREDGILQEVDLSAGRVLRRWQFGSTDITSLDISPDGRTLIANGSGIHIVDLASGKERFTGEGHSEPARWLSFDPDGRTLVSTSYGRVCLWDMTPRTPEERAAGRQLVRGAPKAVLDPVKSPFSVGAFATESRRLFVHTSTDMALIDPDSAKVVRKVFDRLDSANFRCWAYAPDGDSLAVSTTLNSIDRIDTRTGRSIGKPIGGIGRLDDMEMLPDNRTLALLLEGGEVAFRDMLTGDAIPPERVDLRRGGTDRRFVNSYSFSGNRLAVWDRFSGRMVAQTEPSDDRENYNNSLSPSGRYAYLIRGANVVLWEVLTGQKYTLPYFHPKGVAVSHMQTSPDSNLLVTSATDTRLYVWDHRLKPPAKPLSRAELDDAWATLGRDSLSGAWRAMGDLATPAGIARIDSLVKLAAPADPARIAALIADLDDDRFRVREAASRELAKLASLAEGQLREAMRVTASSEVSARLKRIVDALSGSPNADRLRLLRLCEMLEKDASAPALKLLERLKSAADLTLSISAADALERLRRLPGREERK